jgi:hypothetical protein
MRKALVVGIDYYESVGSLYGCVNDAYSVNAVLERNMDGSRNFHTKLMTSTDPDRRVKRQQLREAIQELFQGDEDINLLYFAGHGYIETAGGYLCPSDIETGDDGISLADITTWANQSRARNKVIILDSCHSGFAGNRPAAGLAELTDGMTILTASTAEQYASEANGAGVFTHLFVDALKGAAANLVGEVTPGSVYAHIDQSLGPWAQRPVFKTNVKTFVSLRRVEPPVPLGDLRRIAELFPVSGYNYPLDPTYEPERPSVDTKSGDDTPPPDPVNTEIFRILQQYNRNGLVVPVGAPHMWHAAMDRKACQLTALGEHYRRLVAEGMI